MSGFPLRLREQLSKNFKDEHDVMLWQVLEDSAKCLCAGFSNRCDNFVRHKITEAVESEHTDQTKRCVSQPRQILTVLIHRTWRRRWRHRDAIIGPAGFCSMCVDYFSQSDRCSVSRFPRCVEEVVHERIAEEIERPHFTLTTTNTMLKCWRTLSDIFVRIFLPAAYVIKKERVGVDRVLTFKRRSSRLRRRFAQASMWVATTQCDVTTTWTTKS